MRRSRLDDEANHRAAETTMTGDPLFNLARNIHDHRNFDEAVLYYIDRKLLRRQQLGFHNQVISSLAASHILTYVLLLHFEGMADERNGGATLTHLLALCEDRRLCGARALRTVLTLGQMAGYVRRVRNRLDGRVYIYEPTEKLVREARHITVQTIGSLDCLVTGRNFEGMPDLDADFVPHLIKTSIRAYVDTGVLIAEYYPAIHDLLMQKGGTSGVAAIVQSHLRGMKPPSTHQIARQFSFSASQVRNIIERAGRHGLLAISANGQVLDAAPLAALYKRYFAREIALYAKYTLGLEDEFRAA
jgi:DNA-binding MarR family transcriptional regulator